MKEFTNTIQQLSPKYGSMNLFDDFLELSICALSDGNREGRFEEIEQKYLPEEVKIIGGALGILYFDYLKNINEGVYVDYLGDYFQQTNGAKTASDNGQFFTPNHICTMMGLMIAIKPNENVCDPCCGSGRTLTSHAFNYRNHAEKCFYVGMDLDKRCVHITALNMYFYGMNGVVIHADSISMEVFCGYRIFEYERKRYIYYLTKEECMPYLFRRTQ
jgi:N-6 DNA Methylase